MMKASFRYHLVCTTTIVALLTAKSCSGLSSPSFGEIRAAVHHAVEVFPSFTRAHGSSTVEQLSNVQVPRRDGGILNAYKAQGSDNQDKKLLLLLHEFFGLTQSICDKADALARDVGCTVIAPDTFRGESSTFIPKCIWLALSTPQDRVNSDLDDVLQYYYKEQQTQEEQQQKSETDIPTSLAVMGFCYGGGKAIRYTCERQPNACTVICYGSPVTDVELLKKLKKPVCGVFGKQDVQFPPPLLEAFQRGLNEANVPDCDIQVYDGVGHAFWKDMNQVAEKEQPEYDAYQQVLAFLKENL